MKVKVHFSVNLVMHKKVQQNNDKCVWGALDDTIEGTSDITPGIVPKIALKIAPKIAPGIALQSLYKGAQKEAPEVALKVALDDVEERIKWFNIMWSWGGTVCCT